MRRFSAEVVWWTFHERLESLISQRQCIVFTKLSPAPFVPLFRTVITVVRYSASTDRSLNNMLVTLNATGTSSLDTALTVFNYNNSRGNTTFDDPITRAVNCSSYLTGTELLSLVTGPLCLSGLNMAAQIFNLIAFALWRQKEPYVYLHVCLAVVALLMMCKNFVVVALRLAPYMPGGPAEVWSSGLLNTGRIFVAWYEVVLLFISVDRWLSVEFAVRYRTHVTRKKVLCTFPITLLVALLLCVPGHLVYVWNETVPKCFRQVVAPVEGYGYMIWLQFIGEWMSKDKTDVFMEEVERLSNSKKI